MGRALLVIAVAGASALLLPSNQSASAAPTPIAYYNFDGSAADSAGGHNGNLINGASIVPNAKVGSGALQLDGIDDFVGLLNNDGVTDFGTMQNGYTIAAWVNPSRVTGVQRVFGNDRSTGASGYGFGLNGANLRHTTFGVKDYNQVGTTVPTNAWTHIAVVMDGNNAAQFYINGQDAGLLTHTAPGRVTTNPFLIGSTSNAGNATLVELYQGLIDDVKVFNTPLPASDVAALAVVPEPTSLGVAALVAAGGLLRRRRR